MKNTGIPTWNAVKLKNETGGIEAPKTVKKAGKTPFMFFP